MLVVKVDLVGVHFIVRVFWAQREAGKRKGVSDAVIANNTYFLRKL